MHFSHWIVTVATLAVLSTVGTPAMAADKQVTLRYASNAPATSPWATQIKRFAQAVEEESQGSIRIEPFFNGQLGNEQDTIQQVARGRIDMGAFSAGSVSLVVPEVQLALLPMYYDGPAESDCLLDTHFKPTFASMLDAKGIKLMQFGEVGEIGLFGKRSYASPADLNGLKAIAYNKINTVMWTSLGVNSSFIGVPEWVSSLQTGLVDVVGSIVSLYVPSGMNKVAPVMTRNYLWNTPSLIVMSKRAWTGLSADQRAAVERAVAREPSDKLRAEIRGMEAKLRQAHVAGGGEIVELNPAQLDAWRKVIGRSWPEMIKTIGGSAEAMFPKVESARGACRSKS